jgi:hypothetical protein
MDHANPFETPTTYKLHRLEYLVFFAVSTVLIILHWRHMNWWLFAGLFFYIDLIGYIPGAIAYRRSPNHRIPKGYYVAYNTMHSLVTQSAVAGLWMLIDKPEWALLALSFHLCGDRGVFGNFLKPFGLPFEPEPNPVYRRLIAALTPDRTEAEVEALAEAVPVGGAGSR